MSSVQLGQIIHRQTDNRFILSRFYRSFRALSKEKGGGITLLSTCALTAAKIYGFIFSYFCLEGTVRSLIDVTADDTFIVRLRPLGDVGGWTALALFAAMALRTLSMGFIKEGEYIRLKSICKKWIRDNKKMIEANPRFHDMLYDEVNKFFDAFNSQCLFSKSLISRRLTVLTIYQETELEEKNPTLCQDRALQEIFQTIKTKSEAASSWKYYFHRLYDGQRAIKQAGGCSRQLGSWISGIALPIIFLLCATLSFVGEFGLGKELFVDREELTDVGHFGEWPFNAIEVISIAFFLHIWCMINEGDFVRTRKIYAEHIVSLEDDDQNLHNRLCDVANEELSQSSTSCHYFKLPSDYQFELL